MKKTGTGFFLSVFVFVLGVVLKVLLYPIGNLVMAVSFLIGTFFLNNLFRQIYRKFRL